MLDVDRDSGWGLGIFSGVGWGRFYGFYFLDRRVIGRDFVVFFGISFRTDY